MARRRFAENRSGHGREKRYPIGPMRWSLFLILVGLLVVGCKSQVPTIDPFAGRTTIPPPPTGSVSAGPNAPYYQPPPLLPTPLQTPSASTPPVVQLPAQPSAQSATPSGTRSTVGQPSSAATTTPRPGSTSTFTPNFLAPRPSSTGTSGTSTPGSTSPAPSSTSPYTPPGGSFDYRGTSTRGSMPLIPTQPNSRATTSFTSVSATRPTTIDDSRMPGPVNDTADSQDISGRKPIIRTIQPRQPSARNNVSDRPRDIADLPKTP